MTVAYKKVSVIYKGPVPGVEGRNVLWYSMLRVFFAKLGRALLFEKLTVDYAAGMWTAWLTVSRPGWFKNPLAIRRPIGVNFQGKT